MTGGFQQNHVSQAVWPWTRPKPAQSGGPARPAAVRVVLQAGVAFAAATAFHVWGGSAHARVMSAFAAGVGVFALTTGLAAPSVFMAVDGFLRRLGHWAGIGITWGLLVPFFYIVFGGARLILRLRGEDPMARGFPSAAPTCWEPHRPQAGADSYAKQY
jgi:hypothetical protein